jgi:hypothetical protein
MSELFLSLILLTIKSDGMPALGAFGDNLGRRDNNGLGLFEVSAMRTIDLNYSRAYIFPSIGRLFIKLELLGSWDFKGCNPEPV